MKKQLLALCLFATSVFAADIDMIIPHPAGGPTDTFSRTVQKSLIEATNNNVIAINKPGADGRIAARFALQHSGTNQTILVFPTGLGINKVLYNDLEYDYSDFDIVVPVAHFPGVLIVNNQLGVNSVKEFIKLAKEKNLSCGSSNTASAMFGKYFIKKLDIPNTKIVPFKGSAEIATMLLGNNIDCAFEPLYPHIMFHRDHKLKIIGVSNPTRSPDLPEVETLSEYIPYTFSNWYGVAVPKKNNGDTAAILQALRQVYRDPAFKATMSELSFEVVKYEDGRKFLDKEYRKYTAVRDYIDGKN
jgi:tripartite-type tricarboxylate transporter receptor subunit TctC